MSEQENISIVRKVIDGFNSHNADATVQYLADNVRSEATGGPDVMNKEQTRMYNKGFIDAFPDMRFDIQDTVAQGDKVAITWVVSATHKKPLQTMTGETIPPTNKAVHVPGATFLEMHNGMITRQNVFWDQVTFLTQLGLLTPQSLNALIQR